MEYITQSEKIFKYLELSLDFRENYFLFTLKQKFNNDLNLFGCFIKDYLIIKQNGKVPSDEELYDSFVLFFEKNSVNVQKRTLLDELDNYAKYYLMIVFEKCNYQELLNAISTINSCFLLEAYPYLMTLINDFYTLAIDEEIFNKKLKHLVDLVIKKMEGDNKINLYNLLNFNDNINLIDNSERLVG